VGAIGVAVTRAGATGSEAGAAGGAAGSGSRAATSCSLARGRALSTMTVVTMPHAKAIRQMPARLVRDRTTSVIDAGAGDETGAIPPIREIRSVRYNGTPTGTASNLFCGVGVASLFD
jgi:hypothetical protein